MGIWLPTHIINTPFHVKYVIIIKATQKQFVEASKNRTQTGPCNSNA